MNKFGLLETALVCAFCETEVTVEVGYCLFCDEYKGVMTVKEFLEVYGE
jgi:hypothetical protein